jgi:photosynthetic reaction center cytochrome c subunit
MRTKVFMVAAIVAVVGFAASVSGPSARGQQAAASAPVTRTAGQSGKNIQVLNDLPADQLIPTMRFFSYSLGVECEFCHVVGDNSKDDKREKKTARGMITMELAINKDNFNGRTNVTCYTCHRGMREPGPVESVESTRIGNPAAATATPPPAPGAAEPAAPTLPTADAILAKYVQALGGEQALRKITNRTITGTRETVGRNTQTDVAWLQGTFAEYQKAPNLSAMFAYAANGQTTGSGFDGSSAWTQNANGSVTEASGTALARGQRAADFYDALDIKSQYSRMIVRPPEKIRDREAYLVIGVPDGAAPERLYFDSQTGLLLRRMTLLQNSVISAPTQTDYLDYRDSNGVKYPSTIKIYDVAGNPAYTVLRVQKVDFTSAVDASKVAKPASKPPQATAR